MMAVFLLGFTNRLRFLKEAASGRQLVIQTCSTVAFQKSQVKDQEEIESTNSELDKYARYKAQVARIMGANPETFTEKDLKDSLEYLFPTALFDRKARPVLMATNPLATSGTKVELMDKYNRPFDPGFFTGFPAYHELKFKIFKIWETELSKPVTLESRYSRLDRGTEILRKPTIVKKTVIEDLLSELLSDKQYEEIVNRLCEVAVLKDNEEAQELLKIYAVPVISAMQNLSIKKQEHPLCYGYRKAAYSEVSLTEGTGVVKINQRSLLDYFPRLQDRLQILYPLQVQSMLGQYDVTATVKGGGMTGQAGAIRLGLSRCIASLPHINMNELFKAGLLTNDTRKVERKKPGQKKARKKFAWVKR